MQESFLENLKTLSAHSVKFVVVGGTAAAIQGCKSASMDLGICVRADPENIARLLSALTEIDAVDRKRPEIRPCLKAEDLTGAARHLLMTVYGPLDVFGEIGQATLSRSCQGTAMSLLSAWRRA